MRAVAIALLYFLLARASLALAPPVEGIAAVWPPSGLLLAALVLSRRASWPAITLAVAGAIALANWAAGNPPLVSVGFALANCAESLLAAWLLCRSLAEPTALWRLRTVVAFAGVAAIGSNALTALLGAGVSSLAFGGSFWAAWRVWWIADGLGMLIIGSAIIVWAAGPSPLRRATLPQIAEAALLAGALVAVAAFVFGSRPEAGNFRLPYLMFPFLFWAALRFGPRGATAFALTLAGIVLWSTSRNTGPFSIAGRTAAEHIAEAQSFLGVASLLALVAAAVMAERQAAQIALVSANARLTREVAERTAALERTNAEQGRYIERLQAVAAIDQAILESRPPADIACVALGSVRQLVPCVYGSVVTFDFAASTVTTLASYHRDEGAAAAPSSAPLDLHRIAEALRCGEVHAVEDTGALPRPPDVIAELQAAHLRAYISVGLLAGGELIGALTLGADRPGPFAPNQIVIAQELAAQLAVAIRHAWLFEEIRAGRERLRRLSQRLVDVQESERRHLARELHDEIGQALTGLSLALTLGPRAPVETIRARVDEAQRQINDLTAQIRSLSLDLRPAMLDDMGLLSALLWFFKRYTAQTGVQVAFKHSNIECRFPPNIEITAYRFVQEALTNVARHAGVDQAVVRLWSTDEILGVQVEDEGRGFDVDAALSAYASNGLSGMRERVVLLGGYTTLHAAPGAGARLAAELPLSGHIERRSNER